jgi:hypothetical protein
MKTIEERAKECSYKIYTSGVEWWRDSNSMIEFGKLCYKKCAKEQKKIDIDKACEWLESYIACGVSPEGTYAFVAKFRKAMEE